MGGLKGVAKSGLREKLLAVTVNRGRVFPSVNPGGVFSRFPAVSIAGRNDSLFPSFVPSFVPAVIVW